MRWGYYVAVVFFSLIASGAVPGSEPPPKTGSFAAPGIAVKTGEFQLTLTTRGPDSAAAKLAQRFGMKPEECGGDYDIAKMPLAIYVPPNYDPAAPPGLLVFLHPARFPEVATSLKPVLDETHLIFVSPIEETLPAWQEAGLLLNIVENLRARYAIDKSRIYLMEGEDTHFLAFAVSDAFTGFISLAKFAYPGEIKLEARGRRSFTLAPHDLHVPEAELMAMSKKRSFVFAIDAGFRPGSEEMYRPSMLGWMTQHGYQHIYSQSTMASQLGYPHIHHDFLKPALAFLNANRSAPSEVIKMPAAPAAQSPATPVPAAPAPAVATPAPAPPTPAPAVDISHEQAGRLLKLARLYIDAKQYSSARSKLNDLIKKYPNDADAAMARQLLVQLPPP